LTARTEVWLWIMQRAAAVFLAGAVVVHLATIIYAVGHGLSAVAILGRIHGNVPWLGFYILFALAAALHGGVGLRTIVREMTRWRGSSLDVAVAGFSVFLAVAGCRAALALFG
jgi:fumarate reductase subunit C